MKPIIKKKAPELKMSHRHDSQSYIDFLQSLYNVNTVTPEELAKLYDKKVTISFNNKTVEIPFDAVIYNELINLMTTIVKEY